VGGIDPDVVLGSDGAGVLQVPAGVPDDPSVGVVLGQLLEVQPADPGEPLDAVDPLDVVLEGHEPGADWLGLDGVVVVVLGCVVVGVVAVAVGVPPVVSVVVDADELVGGAAVSTVGTACVSVRPAFFLRACDSLDLESTSVAFVVALVLSSGPVLLVAFAVA
jgi:hypothetical protein